MTNIAKLAAAAVATLGSFALGFSLTDVAQGKMPSMVAFGQLVGGRSDQKATPTQVFRDHYGRIVSSFFRPVDPQRLKYAAMEGMFTSLGDPHTSFLEPKVAESFAMETRGDFVGVGARLSDDALGAKVMVVFKNSPADRAGVRVGDVIVAVDGKDVGGVAVDDIVTKIRGEEGTTVRLTLLRSSEPKPMTVPIVRAVVVLPTAEGKILPSNIGYVNVTGFSEPTPQQFDQAIAEINTHRPSGLIIDMRGNPGGLLEVATEILSRFVENKTVVTMKGKNGESETVTTPAGRLAEIPYPVAVLINEESASAAEIFAGVLRDYKKATLVGKHSYGKASVQNVFTLVDQASAKVTIARYYLPSGDDISRRVDEHGTYVSGGLEPDIIVPLRIDKNTVIGEPDGDSQLARAIELIKEKRGQTIQARKFSGREFVWRIPRTYVT